MSGSLSSSYSTKKSSKSSRTRLAALRAGRPPSALAATSKAPATTSKSSTSLSSKYTRALINTHHLLHKRLASAREAGDKAQIQHLEAQLEVQGGLKAYQNASRTGQSSERGGDSSRLLVQWIDAETRARKTALQLLRQKGEDVQQAQIPLKPIRILEVGALSTQNALNISDITKVRRIDLRSSETGIEEIDFMDLSPPYHRDGERTHDFTTEVNDRNWWRKGYDVLSLSLVLNYVPDPKARGEMLRRTTLFFDCPAPASAPQPSSLSEHNQSSKGDRDSQNSSPTLPCLFLVLPSPCIHNSRYLNPEHLASILSSLGYAHLQTKTTRKLHYSLWRYDGTRARLEWTKGGGSTMFKKKEINRGGGRNNFCIILDQDTSR